MANTKRIKRSAPKRAEAKEPDSIYFLKLVLYMILGAQWLRLTYTFTLPIPIGLIVGLLFARTERFQIDRKIEYAVLLVATFIGFWLPLGIEIVL